MIYYYYSHVFAYYLFSNQMLTIKGEVIISVSQQSSSMMLIQRCPRNVNNLKNPLLEVLSQRLLLIHYRLNETETRSVIN